MSETSYIWTPAPPDARRAVLPTKSRPFGAAAATDDPAKAVPEMSDGDVGLLRSTAYSPPVVETNSVDPEMRPCNAPAGRVSDPTVGGKEGDRPVSTITTSV